MKKNGRNNNCLPASVAEVGEQALKVGRCTPLASKSLQEGCTWELAVGGPSYLKHVQLNHSL